MKIDLRQNGLGMLFRQYEEIMVRHMWQEGIEPTGSGKIWQVVNEKLQEKDPEDSISRASVIFAANRNVDNGIWDWKDATGKGGHHRRYFAKMSEAEMWASIRGTMDEKIP